MKGVPGLHAGAHLVLGRDRHVVAGRLAELGIVQQLRHFFEKVVLEQLRLAGERGVEDRGLVGNGSDRAYPIYSRRLTVKRSSAGTAGLHDQPAAARQQ